MCRERTEAVIILVPSGPIGKLAERLTLWIAWHNGLLPVSKGQSTGRKVIDFCGVLRSPVKEVTVESISGRCAGLDVHKRSISACIRISEPEEKHTVTATFRTFTEDLHRLCEWLKEHKVRQVALESTGVFWIPVWNILERSEAKFEMILINGQHVHASPGRKTYQNRRRACLPARTCGGSSM